MTMIGKPSYLKTLTLKKSFQPYLCYITVGYILISLQLSYLEKYKKWGGQEEEVWRTLHQMIFQYLLE
ncbi:hypothetical protein Y032_0075g941 [Ancylostoma ceylanicum]|uniref:Uncharacterized protein n=1 Tax=Ancylostoma ceylanicum TaxID=53326 RepID=A0A016TUU1_9BILA|nr:hypothetical protein Y032_0075g941 [Ancylostoma ceylanicum]